MIVTTREKLLKAVEPFGLSESRIPFLINGAAYALADIALKHNGCILEHGLQNPELGDRFILNVYFQSKGSCCVLFSSENEAMNFCEDEAFKQLGSPEIMFRVRGQEWKKFLTRGNA